MRKQLISFCQFDYLPQIHHRYPVRDLSDHSQIMSDKDIGQVKITLQVHDQVQDLRLY